MKTNIEAIQSNRGVSKQDTCGSLVLAKSALATQSAAADGRAKDVSKLTAASFAVSILLLALISLNFSSNAIAQTSDPMTLKMKRAKVASNLRAKNLKNSSVVKNKSHVVMTRGSARSSVVVTQNSSAAGLRRSNLQQALAETSGEQNTLASFQNGGSRRQSVGNDSAIEFASIRNEDSETGIRAQGDLSSQMQMQKYRRNKKEAGDTGLGGLQKKRPLTEPTRAGQARQAPTLQTQQVRGQLKAKKSVNAAVPTRAKATSAPVQAPLQNSLAEGTEVTSNETVKDIGGISQEMRTLRPMPKPQVETASGFSANFLNSFIFNVQNNENNVSRFELTPSYGFLPHLSFDSFVAASTPMQKTEENRSLSVDDIEMGLTAAYGKLPLDGAMTWGGSVNAAGILPTSTDARTQTLQGGWAINQALDLDARVVIFRQSNRFYSYYYEFKDYYPDGVDTSDSSNLVANTDYYLENRLDANIPLGSRRLLWKNDWRNEYTHKIYGKGDAGLRMRTRLGYQFAKYLWLNGGIGAYKSQDQDGSLFDSKRMNVNFSLFWSI